MPIESTLSQLTTNVFNVRDYGACGDGLTKDTHALQQAIDACALNGGGAVLLPPGNYLSGTIYLKSHVEFHLAAGAALLGSPDREDYNAADFVPENQVFAADCRVTGAHLIVGYRQENVAITGLGIIDGQSASFFEPLPEGDSATYRTKSASYPIPEWRPGQMVFFCCCRHVAVRDVSLINAPYWTLFTLGCNDIQIRGLTITNPPATRNGDGIDIDCSRNVTISDCIIRSGDDCITVRGNKRPLGDAAQPCENVTVTNCILSSPCNAIRVGVGDGEIRRCTFSNIVVTESRTAINMVSRYSRNQAHGVLVEQIHFSNFTVDALLPFVVNTGEEAAPPAAMRDISFTGFRIIGGAGSQLTGSAAVPLQRIRMTDFEWLVRGGTSNCEFVTEMPEVLALNGHHGARDTPALPCLLYGQHLEHAHFENIRVRWENLSPVWRDGLFFRHCGTISLRNLTLRPPHETGAAIHGQNCAELSLYGCRAESDTRTFLRMESSRLGTSVRCIGNDFSGADTAFEIDVPLLETGNLYSPA